MVHDRTCYMLRFTAFFNYCCILLACCFYSTNSHAQLCTGSLGDPVVNIDFGNGYGSNTGYTPTNAYVYTSDQCPNDGYYTITRSTSNCFGNTWHTVSSDHTGNGAFLLVNATYNPGDFIVTRVTDLCPNITYEFAAWILNVMKPNGNDPNITFTIETESGTILQQYSTGDIPETGSPTWKQYGFYFTTPVNNPVIILRMKNNAPGGYGNDIAMDDITFRPCSAVLLSSHISGGSNDTVHVCEGASGSYNMNGMVTGTFVNPVYQWQLSTDSGKKWKDINGASNLNYTARPVAAGAYWYRFTAVESASSANTSCRVASNYTVVNIHEKPEASAGGNRIMIAGVPIILNGKVTGGNTFFNWSPPAYLNDATVEKPQASPPADIRYTLNVTTGFGCTAQDTAYIKVIKGIFAPNSFTPNNDGKNDQWRIPYLDPALGARVSVFNRYGERVYYCEGAVVHWDGTYKGMELPSGVYVFQVQFSNGYPDMKGTVLLIR